MKHNNCYATHKYDVGKSATPQLREPPFREKLKNLLEDLEKDNIIKQIGPSPEDKPNFGTTYLNPLIIIPKGDSINCVLDARHLNSNTERSDESWPREPLAPQLARAIKKYKCAIDLMYVNAHIPLG